MLWHRSVGLGIVVKLMGLWVVGEALRLGRESCRVEIEQSHRTRERD